MKQQLLALVLACLNLSLGVEAIYFGADYLMSHHITHVKPIRVDIYSDQNVNDLVAAINSQGRSDITVKTHPVSQSAKNIVAFVVTRTFGILISTGVVLALYKRYCRLLGIKPEYDRI